MKGGWYPHPHAISRRGNAIDDRASFPTVKPAGVVGLGALMISGRSACRNRATRASRWSEFVTLEDGRRVTLHEDRGFTIGRRSTRKPGPIGGQHATLEEMTRHVLTTVLPDDDAGAEDHPWSWLAELARARGLNVTADDLRDLPYDVVFTDKVRRWLAPA